MTHDFLEDELLSSDSLDEDSLVAALPSWLTSGEVVGITPVQVQQAVALGSRTTNPAKQWQVYRNALALFGFINWLQDSDRAIADLIDESCCSIFQPAWAATVDAVCNVQIGDLKVCVIASEDPTAQIITIPRVAVSTLETNLADFTAHFYVFVGVQEDEMDITVHRFLTCEELRRRLKERATDVQNGWNYEVPMEWFNQDLERLLLDLRFLTPQALEKSAEALPVQNFYSLITNIQAWWEDKLEELLHSGRSLEEVLNWKQGAQVIGCLPILELVSSLSTNSDQTKERIQGLLNNLLTPRTSWMPLAPAEAVRSLASDFDEAIAHYQEQTGIHIPSSTERIEQELEALRVRLLKWLLSPREYVVVAFLIAKQGEVLQVGTCFWVATAGVWSEQWVQEGDSYIATTPLLISVEEPILIRVKPPNEHPSSFMVNLVR